MNAPSISQSATCVNAAPRAALATPSAQDKAIAAALRDHQLDLDQQWQDGRSAFFRGVPREACQTETMRQGYDVAAAEALVEWVELHERPTFDGLWPAEGDHEVAAQPYEPAAPTTTRPVYVVHATACKLSADALAFLRRLTASWRRDGMSARDAAAEANAWCRGYRAVHQGVLCPAWLTASYFAGREFARGELAYWQCMAETGDEVPFA